MTQPSVRIGAVDLNGQLRGKRTPPGTQDKLIRMPYSLVNVDITGADIEGSKLVFETGDQDCLCHPTGRGPVPMPWLAQDTVLQLVTMHHDDGTPFAADPRHALVAVLDRFAQQGLSVIAACELEFYLVNKDGGLTAATDPVTGRVLDQTAVLSLRELDHFEAFFNDVEGGAALMGIDPLTITSEAGVGQFEITMTHGPALKIADDIILLKELIKGTARKHGMAATFMAKPFAMESGNGMHTHFSVLDDQGQNVFMDQSKLEAAIAGCLDLFTDSTLFFAPHANSFDRFVEGAHAPINATWGYDNRTVAVRVPGGPPVATRIEHRVAGGDVNPYLNFAAICGRGACANQCDLGL